MLISKTCVVLAMAATMLLPASSLHAEDDTDLAEDEPSSTCPLAGLQNGAVAVAGSENPAGTDERFSVCLYNNRKRLHCLTVAGWINEAKLQIECRGNKIKIWTEQGFSAASTTYNLQFAKGKLTSLKKEQVDPSQQSMKEYEKALKKGDIKGAISAIDDVLYPDHYYNAKDACAELMVTAHKQAGAALRKKFWSDAIGVMKPAADWCANVTLDDKSGTTKNGPFILALNDYGFALVESGAAKDGEAILAKVVAMDKERAPAWLNLADAQVAQKKDGAAAYDEYCKRVPKAKRPKRVTGLSKTCQ